MRRIWSPSRGTSSPDLGFTMLELAVVLSISSIMMGILAFSMRDLTRPSENAANILSGHFKRTRALALNSTRAYTLTASGDHSVVATYGSTCSSATQTAAPELTLELPSGATFTNTAWSICYGTRGISDSSADIEIADADGESTVQVSLGGGVRVL